MISMLKPVRATDHLGKVGNGQSMVKNILGTSKL